MLSKFSEENSKFEEAFKKCTTNLDRVNFFFHNEELRPLTKVNIISCPSKNDEEAKKMRDLGNTRFKKKLYFEALEFYTYSIASAESAEIASLAYANRSALLAQRKHYQECIIDIDRAFANYPEKSKVKLILRKQECVRNLKTESISIHHEKQETKNIIVGSTEQYGRELLAKQNFEIGDLILTEEPFAFSIVRNEEYFIYCHECLKLSYNPIPCKTCTQIFYCSDICRTKSWQWFHKYECKILATIDEVLPNFKTVLTLALKMTILAKIHPKTYNNIGKLLTHTKERPFKELFQSSLHSAIIFSLIKELTTIFEDYQNFENEFKESFLRNLQIIDINAVSINRLELNLGGYDTVRYAWAIYNLFSLLNHSCNPNCFFYHDGSRVVVRALSTIQKGEQCFISYCFTYGTEAKLTRQSKLLNKYHFTCSCEACRNNWPEETGNNNFDEPFAAVQLSLLEKDTKMLETLKPIFIKKLKSLEKYPVSGISCFKQLIVDCYQVYESLKNF